MHAGHARGVNHLRRIAVVHPRDVLAHGAAKELHVLRQIADIAAEIVAVPGKDIGAVEADETMLRLGQPHDQPGERRFAGGRRSDDAESFTGSERKRDAPQHRVPAPGGA